GGVAPVAGGDEGPEVQQRAALDAHRRLAAGAFVDEVGVVAGPDATVAGGRVAGGGAGPRGPGRGHEQQMYQGWPNVTRVTGDVGRCVPSGGVARGERDGSHGDVPS